MHSSNVPIIIQVTEEDIQLGKPGNSTLCPIARAIKRTTHCSTASWGYITGTARFPNDEFRIYQAKEYLEVSRFVIDFDSHEPVEPFSLTLSWYKE